MTRMRAMRFAAIAAACLATIAAVTQRPSDARARSARPTPIEQRLNLRPGLQLAAMRAAISAGPSFYPSFDTRCSRITPVLAAQQGQVLAGNFRDADGACYIWLNLVHAPLLNAQDICKLTLHESGHLAGLQHSPDPDNVMYSPYRAEPMPQPCLKPLAAYSSSHR